MFLKIVLKRIFKVKEAILRVFISRLKKNDKYGVTKKGKGT